MITDKKSGLGVTLNYGQHMINEGLCYLGTFTGSAGANTSGEVLLIRTGAESTILNFNINATANGVVNLLENQSQYTTGTGTAVILYNIDRNGTGTTLTKIYSMVTDNAFSGITGATKIARKQVVSAAGEIGLADIKLKSSATYCLEYMSMAGTSTSNYGYTIYLTKELSAI